MSNVIRAPIVRLAAAAIFASAGCLASTASAATLTDFDGDKNIAPYTEDGFSFAPARIVNGNCLSNGCLALNDNESTSMTSTAVPNLFTLSGLSFNLLGRGTDNYLRLTGSNGTSLTYTVASFAKNAYHTLTFGNEFANVSSVLFSTGGGGNVRIDDVQASPAPVPLPAAGWLIVAGLGALGALRRRARATV
jgi:hypothetical protein